MKRLKSNDPNLDRLSALPDSLIHEIFSLLKMRDVVRTSLLSKRWNYLWITTPCLQFLETDDDPIKVRNFVSRALTLWRGTHLRKFSIEILCADKAASLSNDVDLWVRFAKERNVEELFIGYRFSVTVPLYSPPQCLYECSSLRKLTLMSCNLRIHGGVQWDRLNSLNLRHCCFHEDELNQIFASSTQLETVELVDFKDCERLSIRSSSLKKLLVLSICDGNLEYALAICAPNLEVLMVKGDPFNKCLLTNLSSLTEVLIDFVDVSSRRQAVGDALCQVLPAIQHVVTVKLSASCLKLFGVMKGKFAFSPLLNVELLRIGGSLAEISELVGLLEIFPKLNTFIIDWEYDKKLLEFNGENYTMSDADILTSNLLQLRTVEIIWTRYQTSIFQFTECLLKHVPAVEKMVIRKKEMVIRKIDGSVVDSVDMFLAAQKVVSLQRSFPSVELILCRSNMIYSACFCF